MTELVLDTDLDSGQRESLEIVQSSAHALLNIINDVLDFSKIEARHIEFDHSEFDLHCVLEDALRDHVAAAHKKQIKLSWHIGAGVPVRVIGDGSRLRQVITNLVGNAVKFTDHGEVTVLLANEDAKSTAVAVHCSVRDTGVGISADKHRGIFEAFVQADSSTHRRFGGTGLGLAICAALVERMQGRMWLESEPGRGSTFHFTARFERAVSVVRGEEVHGPAEVLGRQVMVVTESALEQHALAEMLAGWGMKAHLVADAEHALDLLSRAKSVKQPFDLVLFGKEAHSGLKQQIVERMRAKSAIRTTTLAALSVAGSEDPSNEIWAALGVRHVTAGSSRDLLDAVCAVLSEPKGAQAVPILEQGRKTQRLRVLLAEDNPVNQKLAVRLLEGAGHQVRLAVNGEQALAAYAAEEFDLILMDVQMPVMDGLEATRELRRLEADGSHTPIIALTASAIVRLFSTATEASR